MLEAVTSRKTVYYWRLEGQILSGRHITVLPDDYTAEQLRSRPFQPGRMSLSQNL